ncbi:spherulation-specific family 4 protein [Kocuria sp. SM24M-10]|uniref:spherulation-specific family 4 protein n=1 Tax=Kocuria sp. SM24M-10 TaxID=1660349 RepID=UPI00069969C9|nr:spherulation-specific family 4 protein [Kocuria sp. SM24M-10]
MSTRSARHAWRRALALLFVGLLAPLGVGIPAQAAVDDQHQLVPAYFYPSNSSSLWPMMCSRMNATGGGSIAIMNPASGPGTQVDSRYTSAVSDCRAKGQKVIGYVHTSYGSRSLSTVKAEIDRYFSFYAVDGVFIDEMSNSTTNSQNGQDLREYYRQVYAHIKSKTGGTELVIGNPGAAASSNWQLSTPVADVVVVFEGTWRTYQSWTPRSWVLQQPSEKIGNLVYATPADRRARACALSKDRNAGNFYVTNDIAPNPWDTLPSYWSRVAPTCT